MAENRIAEQYPNESSFTITPTLARLLTDTVYEYALWTLFREIAHEDRECYVSTRDLAALSNMSIGSVSGARRGLMEKGLLKGRRVDLENGRFRWYLSIPQMSRHHFKVLCRLAGVDDQLAWKKAQGRGEDVDDFLASRHL